MIKLFSKSNMNKRNQKSFSFSFPNSLDNKESMSYDLFWDIIDIKQKIAKSFPQVDIFCSYDKNADEYMISINNEKTYFSSKYLKIINSFIDKLESKNVHNVLFTCDANKQRNNLTNIEIQQPKPNLNFSSLKHTLNKCLTTKKIEAI